MRYLAFVPITLSLLVLGAHFMRSGSSILVFVAGGLVALLAIRRAWVARLVQLVLVLGAIEWTRTLLRIAAWRSETGEPFLRMVAILGTVAAITLISAALFQTPTLRRIYGLDKRAATDDSPR